MPDDLYSPVTIRGLPALDPAEAAEFLTGVAQGGGARKIAPERLAAAILAAAPGVTAGLAGAVQRSLLSKLGDYPTVLDFGSGVGTGDGDVDTAAFIAAAAAGHSFSVPTPQIGYYGIGEAPVVLDKAHGQRVIGLGATIITYGAEDIFRLRGDRDGQGISGLRFDAKLQTAGSLIDVRGTHRWHLDDIRTYEPWNGLYVEGSNTGHIGDVWAYQVRGEFGVRLYGSGEGAAPGAIRSDAMSFHHLLMSMAPGAGAIGFDWDGNAHSVTIGYLGTVAFDRGMWLRNTAGGSAPSFGAFKRVEHDFPQHEGVRIEAGWEIDFMSLHSNNSYLADCVYVGGAAVPGDLPGDMVRVGNHTITNSQVGYGINADGVRVQVYGSGSRYGNALGETNGNVAHTVPRTEWGQGFYAGMSGNTRMLAWEGGSADTFVPGTGDGAHFRTIDDTVVMTQTKLATDFAHPVAATQFTLGPNTYLRRVPETGAVVLVVNGDVKETWGP